MAQLQKKNQRDPQTYAIIGAAIEVHKCLGSGFLEPVYQEALAWEFREKAIPFVRESLLSISYKGRQLETNYRADFVCFGSVIVEIKALKTMGATEEAQAINYLKASGIELAFLLDFGGSSLTHQRYILTK